MSAWLIGQADVGATGVGLGGGVGVVDHDRLFVVVPHLFVEVEQFTGVELIKRWAASRIDHFDVPGGGVTAFGSRDDSAGFIGVIALGVGHDGVADLGRQGEHVTRVRRGRGVGFPVSLHDSADEGLLHPAEPQVNLVHGSAWVVVL